MVALIWLLVPAFGALPFVLGAVPQLSRPVDAYFEALSGFTATGATLVPKIEALPRSMLFWRQLSHWLGGMGIIILAVAVLPRLRVGGRQLLQSELAGPTEIERFAEHGPGDGPAAVAALRGPDRGGDPGAGRCSAGPGSTPRWACTTRSRTRSRSSRWAASRPARSRSPRSPR